MRGKPGLFYAMQCNVMQYNAESPHLSSDSKAKK